MPSVWPCGGRLRSVASAALAALFSMSTPAGQSCNETLMSPEALTRTLATAQHVVAELDKLPVDAALLARVGQNLSSYGLKYSHVGFVYRSAPGAPWRIAHLLNSCGTAQSDLWYEGVGNFFLGDMVSYDALVMVPPKPVADALVRQLQDGPAMRAVHDPAYSLAAYPFSTRYQNSNTWVLETLASVESKDVKIRNREQAQSWLKLARYQPSEMHVAPLTRLGGRMFKANVAFDDHPNELRFSDRIRTVTVDSIRNFVVARDEGWRVIELPAMR